MAEAARKDKGKDDAGAAVVPIRPDGPTLTIHSEQEWWTPAQQAALEAIGLKDCPTADRMAFLHLCQKTGLDPFTREIYLIGRKDRDMPSGKRWTAQTGIDGFRHIAERTGVYGGRIGPLWCGPDGQWSDVWLGDGPPHAARVGLIRTDKVDPATGGPMVTWATCLYDEYVPLVEVWEGSGNNRRAVRNDDGSVKTKPGGMWGKMPANQLAKCAEAAAVRAAFPRAATGIYEQAEMDQADALATAALQAGAREDLRGELASRPWRRPAEGDPDAPEVVDGEVVVVPPREALLEELAGQARVMGQSIPQWTRRWAAAHHMNAEDASDVELFELVRSRRQMVEDKCDADGVPAPAPAEGLPDPGEWPVPDAAPSEQGGLDDAAAPDGAVGDAGGPPGDAGGPPGAAEGQGALIPADGAQWDAQDPPRHLFVGDGDRCEVDGCGRYLDDEDVHGA